jgi:hypothetical protein
MAEYVPPAIIYVDGEEFIRCQPGEDFKATFEDVVDKVGGEVALLVWKPFWQAYLREKLSITMPKEI